MQFNSGKPDGLKESFDLLEKNSQLRSSSCIGKACEFLSLLSMKISGIFETFGQKLLM